MPSVRLFDRLVNRQCVDEFVGDDDVGAAWDIGEPVVPQHRHCQSFQPELLLLFQSRADLDEMQDDRSLKIFDDFRGPECVDHQRAMPRAKLDNAHVFRRAHLLPDRSHPQADQLAEHLADLRRGDEVAAGADRVVGDVIAVLRMGESEPHIIGKRHWSGDRDQSADFTFERRIFISHF